MSAQPSLGHLVLVGLPGAGKSTVGAAVARRLRRPFLDFDRELERREGMLVSALFAERGEEAFRQMEIDLTKQVVGLPPMVLSPGGGWITNPGVLALVRPPGRIIHLRISPAGALRRMGRGKARRPLLQTDDPKAALDRLWERRAKLYAQSDLEIDTEVVGMKRVVEQIVALARGLDVGLG